MNENDNFDEQNLDQDEQEQYSFPQFGTGKQFVDRTKNAIDNGKKVADHFKNKNKETNNNSNNKGLDKKGKPNNQNNANAGKKKKKSDNEGPLNKGPKKSGLNKDSNNSLLDKKKKNKDGKSDNKKETEKKDKKDKKDKKEKDKKAKDKKKKKQSFKNKIKEGAKKIWAKIPLKIKLIIILVALFIIVLFIIFVIIFPSINAGVHSISGSFSCEMGYPLPEDDIQLLSGYGWRVHYFGGSYWNKYAITKNPLCEGACDEKCNPITTSTVIYDYFGNPIEIDETGKCDIYAYEGITYTENIYTGEYSNSDSYYYDLKTGEMKVANFNNGIDLKSSSNNPIFAVHPGTISSITNLGNSGLGTYTIIDHEEASDFNIKTIYGHMSSTSTDFGVNDLVVMEDSMGIIGNTGNSHYRTDNLYMEIQQDGIGMSLNGYFGYAEPSGSCGDRASGISVLSIEKSCGTPIYIGKESGMANICNTINNLSIIMNPPNAAPGEYTVPVSYSKVTSCFGMYTAQGSCKMHYGLDFGAAGGTSVHATKSGTVASIKTGVTCSGLGCCGGDDSYGNNVLIDHGDGTKSRYAHLSSVVVHVGDSVTKGQLIGGVGTTGCSDGYHLHFEIYVNGARVNPTGYIGVGCSDDVC